MDIEADIPTEITKKIEISLKDFNNVIKRIQLLEQQTQQMDQQIQFGIKERHLLLGHLQELSNQYSLISTKTFSGNRLEPKMPLPEKFDGIPKKFRDFKASVETIFQFQPSRFYDDKIKIGFLGTLLSGTALSWYRSYYEVQDSILEDYDQFMDLFSQTFSDPNISQNARRMLRNLRQGTRSATTYAAEFRRIANDTGYNETAKIEAYRFGLSEALKDELSRIDNPEDFDMLVNLTIKIDQRLYERRVERQGSGAPGGQFIKNKNKNYNSFTSTKNSPTPTPPPRTFSSSFNNTYSPPMPSLGRDPHAMDLDSILTQDRKLTPQEKDRRRREGLCAYCGDSNHGYATCPHRSDLPKPTPSSKANPKA